MALACTIIGLLLTGTGIVLAGRALVQDWRTHGQGRPLFSWLAEARVWFLRRVLRRPPVVSRGSGSALVSVRGTASGSGVASPAADAPVEVQITYLREQVRTLHKALGQQRNDIDVDIGKVRSRVSEVESKALSAVAQVEDMARDIATGTTHLQLLGLVLVGLGSAIGALPALFG